jgi:hypothetical protein
MQSTIDFIKTCDDIAKLETLQESYDIRKKYLANVKIYQTDKNMKQIDVCDETELRKIICDARKQKRIAEKLIRRFDAIIGNATSKKFFTHADEDAMVKIANKHQLQQLSNICEKRLWDLEKEDYENNIKQRAVAFANKHFGNSSVLLNMLDVIAKTTVIQRNRVKLHNNNYSVVVRFEDVCDDNKCGYEMICAVIGECTTKRDCYCYDSCEMPPCDLFEEKDVDAIQKHATSLGLTFTDLWNIVECLKDAWIEYN